ncbi:MAG: glycoside hydrolase family 15 protein [Candidatus Nanopelagicales bacterium]
MPALIEDYALIGDLHTSALVSREGAIDWLCLPRLDSDACFAALLGDEANGHWTIRPTGELTDVTRAYRQDTLVLETTMTTADGVVRIVDFMPIRREHEVACVIRIVEGVTGRVTVRSTFAPRFGFGRITPYYLSHGAGLHAQAGPDTVLHIAPEEVTQEGGDAICEISVGAGDRRAFQMIWHRPWAEREPIPQDPFVADKVCTGWWQKWAATATYTGEHRDAVVRSLITLKALSYKPTGAVAAAATTSLPEAIGGERNWDYRYTWLRDASMTLQALLDEGYREEAYDFRQWVLRAVAGDPAEMQIMYSITGKRHLPESTIDWLPGYENSAPVRIGNGAAGQFQLDVYGELSDAAYLGRTYGMTAPSAPGASWGLQLAVAGFVEKQWKKPDEGIWEVRGDPQHFTYSKVMAWVAIDRVVRCIDEFGLVGDRERWKQLADTIHEDICANAIDPARNCFTQYYGSTAMDASLLMIPLVGFLPPDDPRIIATVNEVERDLSHDGLMLRYRTDETHDGLAGEEGTFLICSFWLVQCLALIGEHERSRVLLDRLLSLRNDVGLLSEEYDPVARRMLGNMPQAFSHIGLINAIHAQER